jgi:hypothetical protein
MVMRASAHSQVEPVANPDAPRIVIRRAPHAFLGGMLLVIASVWIGIPIRAILAGTPEVVPGLGSLGAGGALVIGCALGLIAFVWMLRREVVVIEGDLVRVSDRRLLRSRIWREPLTGYRGVRRRRETRPHRYGPRHRHVIELWHPKAERTVELARNHDPRLADEQAAAWAKRLRLSLCRDLGELPEVPEPDLRTAIAAARPDHGSGASEAQRPAKASQNVAAGSIRPIPVSLNSS